MGSNMATYINIPKVIRKVQEKKYGKTWRWVWISLGSAGFIVIMLVLSMFTPWFVDAILYALIISYIIFFWMYLKNDEVLDRSQIKWSYFIRKINGQTILPKYIMTVPFLRQIVPILAVHKNGLIEFTEKRWGMILEIDPGRISDDELDTHIIKVKEVMDSLHGDMVMKTFACSRSNVSGAFRDSLVQKLNDGTRTKAQKEHLYSIYNDTSEKQKPIIEWQFYIFLGMGLHDDAQSAERARQSLLPGFENRLRYADMHVVPILKENDIAMAYRRCMTQVVL
jgi:hypothetical protein